MRIFGEIEGVTPGDQFENRIALREVGVHRPNQKGISGSAFEGADSIVLSGGYEDDEDYGDVIIYTGAGGQKNNKQVSDQELIGVNLALAKSKIEKLPVRVVRGHKHKHELSPVKGYRYAGLYDVESYWCETGKSGYKVYRYKLVAQKHSISAHLINEPVDKYLTPGRKPSTINRIIRNYQKAQNVKSWHKHQCQVCGLAIKTSAGLYAQAAHIKALGAPHNGPDIESNILCLCPNHHVMFDNGGFAIKDNLELIGIEGKLRTTKKHKINIELIKYHRNHHYKHTP
ncbi:HNH endonuclease [Catenovulum sp. SM1970]|uniref:YDG/SRA domain-containing protein n=1 Tax=Marinifaba aquimaris TaxID=2741323 RepID=UPI001571BF42|nr:YDG/SRA domain-containing protein [Marinifaba aquimaris]NTS76320.1 HNH endonuclease [Marinifaba aquimaris]